MSASGFHWEGFFRAMQGDITGVVAVIVCSITTLIVYRTFLKGTRLLDDSVKARARKLSSNIAYFVILIALFYLGWKIVTVTASNRMPRSDVDKSGVYQQMDSASEHAE